MLIIHVHAVLTRSPEARLCLRSCFISSHFLFLVVVVVLLLL